MNTATGTKHEKESSDERVLRRKGLCLVPRSVGGSGQSPFRILLSDDLREMERFRERIPRDETDSENRVNKQTALHPSFSKLVIAATVAGGIIGYLLGRKER